MPPSRLGELLYTANDEEVEAVAVAMRVAYDLSFRSVWLEPAPGAGYSTLGTGPGY